MIENLIFNIGKTYDPRTNNVERRAAFEHLQNYQKHLFQLDHLPNLIDSKYHSNVKIFGLKCFENIILTKWNNIDKEKAKQYIIQLIQDYDSLNISSEFSTLGQWIISKCVMYFVRYECPQNCEFFIKGIIEIAKCKSNKIDSLVLSIFLCLSEYLPTDSDMPEKRKKDVISYLNQESEIILEYCLDILKLNYQSHNFMKHSILNCLESFCGWVKISSIIKHASIMFSTLILSCQRDNQDFRSLSVFQVIFERKLKPHEKIELLKSLINDTNSLDQLFNTFNFYFAFDPNYNEDRYRCIQKASELSVIYGNIIMENLDQFDSNLEQNFLSEIFRCILTTTLSAIKVISTESLSFWTNHLKANSVIVQKIILTNSDHVMNLLKSYSYPINIEDLSNRDVNYLKALFDENDIDAFNTKIKSETSYLLIALTNKSPDVVLQFSFNWFNGVMEKLRANNAPQYQLQYVQELKSLHYFFKHVINYLLKMCSSSSNANEINDPNTSPLLYLERHISSLNIQALQNCKDQLVSLDSNEPNVISICIELLGIFFPFCRYNDQMDVQTTIERIFLYYIQAHQTDDVAWRSTTLSASINIVRIFRSFPYLVSTNLFECIMKFVMDQPKPIYRHSILVEALVMYICHSKQYNFDDQMKLIQKIIVPIHSFFKSIEPIIESDKSFIVYFQLDQPQPTNLQDRNWPNEEARICRESLVGASNSLLGMIRRIYSLEDNDKQLVKQPVVSSGLNTVDNSVICSDSVQLAGSVLVPILPIVMTILKTVNLIWTSPLLHQDFKSMYNMSKYYRESVVMKKTGISRHDINAPDYYFEIIRHTLSMLTDFNWTLLGKSCKLIGRDLYCLSYWPESIVSYLLANFESMPNYKVRELFKLFMIPFVQHCPGEIFQDVSQNIIIPFIDFNFQKLNNQWKAVKDEDIENMKMEDEFDSENNSQNGPIQNNRELDDEIVKLQILTLLSRSFVDLFKTVLTKSEVSNHQPLAPNSKNTKTQAEESNTNPNNFGWISQLFMINNGVTNGKPPLLLLWLHELTSAMVCWRDSYCTRRISALVPDFVKEAKSLGLITPEIVSCLVERIVAGLNLAINVNQGDIRVNLFNVLVMLYTDYLSQSEECWSEFYSKYLSSYMDQKAVTSFKSKMMHSTNMKNKREHIEKLLKPHIGDMASLVREFRGALCPKIWNPGSS